MPLDMNASVEHRAAHEATIVTERPDRSLSPRLPEAAAEKLRALQEARDEASAVARAAEEARSETFAAKLEIERELRKTKEIRRVTRMPSRGEVIAEDPDVLRLRDKLERAQEELRRRDEKADARKHRAAMLGGLVANNLNREIGRLSEPPALWHGTPTKPNKGETLPAAVERLRRKREGLLADLREVEAAPRPASEAKLSVATEINALAERGRPNLLGLVERGNPLTRPKARAEVSAWKSGERGVYLDPSPPTVIVADAIGLVAWVFRDQLIVALNAEIDALADDKAALSDDQRRDREVEIRSQILAAERDEESLIEQAEGAGGEILRRTDQDYRAVLHLADDTPAPRH